MYAPTGFTRRHTSAKMRAACSHPTIVIAAYLRIVRGAASRTSGIRAQREPRASRRADRLSYLVTRDHIAVEQPERDGGEHDEPDLEHDRVHRVVSMPIVARRSAVREASGQIATSRRIHNITAIVRLARVARHPSIGRTFRLRPS